MLHRTVAKQEALEEKIRLKNQFRSLDEDEVEFLDSILESTRAQEAAVKKDTADQLEAFRKQREEAEKAMLESTSTESVPREDEEWNISARKRRRDKGKDFLLPGKKRKASTTTENGGEANTPKEQKSPKQIEQVTPVADRKDAVNNNVTGLPVTDAAGTDTEDAPNPTMASSKPPSQAPRSVGLVGYRSDSDSE